MRTARSRAPMAISKPEWCSEPFVGPWEVIFPCARYQVVKSPVKRRLRTTHRPLSSQVIVTATWSPSRTTIRLAQAASLSSRILNKPRRRSQKFPISSIAGGHPWLIASWDEIGHRPGHAWVGPTTERVNTMAHGHRCRPHIILGSLLMIGFCTFGEDASAASGELTRSEIEQRIAQAGGNRLDLGDSDLSGLDLSGLSLAKADFFSSNLAGADLSGAELADPERSPADFEASWRVEPCCLEPRNSSRLGMSNEEQLALSRRGDHRGLGRKPNSRGHLGTLRVEANERRLVLTDDEEILGARCLGAEGEKAEGGPISPARGRHLFSLDLLLQSLQPCAQKVGHCGPRCVVVEIVRRLVAGVTAVEPPVPMDLTAAGSRRDHKGRRIGADRKCVEIGIGHPVGIFERRRLIFVEALLQRATLAQGDAPRFARPTLAASGARPVIVARRADCANYSIDAQELRRACHRRYYRQHEHA